MNQIIIRQLPEYFGSYSLDLSGYGLKANNISIL